MLRAVLISLHACAGLLALGAGVVALRRGRLFGTYLWSLTACILILFALVAVDWNDLSTGSRIFFSALSILGAVMVWRAVRAGRLLATDSARPRSGYWDHIGFTLIALLDAFLVILVLDLRAPAWVLVAVGILVAAGGHRELIHIKQKAASTMGGAPRAFPG